MPDISYDDLIAAFSDFAKTDREIGSMQSDQRNDRKEFLKDTKLHKTAVAMALRIFKMPDEKAADLFRSLDLILPMVRDLKVGNQPDMLPANDAEAPDAAGEPKKKGKAKPMAAE